VPTQYEWQLIKADLRLEWEEEEARQKGKRSPAERQRRKRRALGESDAAAGDPADE
jgi:hypothetical protein